MNLLTKPESSGIQWESIESLPPTVGSALNAVIRTRDWHSSQLLSEIATCGRPVRSIAGRLLTSNRDCLYP